MAKKKAVPLTTPATAPVKVTPCNFIGCPDPATRIEDGTPYCPAHQLEYLQRRAEEYLVTVGLEQKPGESKAHHIKRMRAWLHKKLAGGRLPGLPWLRKPADDPTPQTPA